MRDKVSQNNKSALILQQAVEFEEKELQKRVSNVLNRVENLLVPDLGVNNYGRPFSECKKKSLNSNYYTNEIEILAPISDYPGKKILGIKWDLLKQDVINIHFKVQKDLGIEITDLDSEDLLPEKVKEEFMGEISREQDHIDYIYAQEKVKQLQKRNSQPCYPNRWKKEAYAPRIYDSIVDYVPTTNINAEEGSQLIDLLNTPRDGFLGQSYNYDDHELTEEWMVTFKDGTNGKATDDEIIKTNVTSLLDIMSTKVQDRVCNETGVLRKEPVELGSSLKEHPVWGLDSYSRRNIEIALEDSFFESRKNDYIDVSSSLSSSGENDTSMDVVEPVSSQATTTANSGTDVSPLSSISSSFSLSSQEKKTMKIFIEQWLLPAINAQELALAHNILYALHSININECAPAVIRRYANIVYTAVQKQGISEFKIHPKGTGVICTAKDGIKPHVLICEYLGEVHPSYRWCERLDVVAQGQKALELKPTLPDFWNILLERPQQDDPRGYGLLYVDASQRSNMGSSCSHSCDANCTSSVIARNGRLAIALTTNRHVSYGEELCMDYSSITSSEVEWRAAICLCGMTNCRGSFLHYATQDDLQQVLTKNCGPLWRFASLLKACSSRPVSDGDNETLVKHGMFSAALGDHPADWIKKYVADCLRFVEFERQALPCALLRGNSGYTWAYADMDARSVMEQRLQSIVCSFSMIGRVLQGQTQKNKQSLPLRPLASKEAAERVWRYMSMLPKLLDEAATVAKQINTNASAINGANSHDKSNKNSNDSNAISNSITAYIDTSNGGNTIFDSNLVHPVAAPLCGSSTVAPAPNGPLSPDVVPMAVLAPISEEVKIESADIRLKKAARAVKSIIDEGIPLDVRRLKSPILRIREVIISVQDLSTSTARLGLLADILVLWAQTNNYSVANMYESVESDPIHVIARDLGVNIKRSTLNQKKTDKTTGRLAARGNTTSPSSSNSNHSNCDTHESRDNPNNQSSSNGANCGTELRATSAFAVGSIAMDGVPTPSLTMNTNTTSSLSQSFTTNESQCKSQGSNGDLNLIINTTSTTAVTTSDNTSVVTTDGETSNSDSPSTVTEPEHKLTRAVRSQKGDSHNKASKTDDIVPDLEVVYEGVKTYSDSFTFWCLMNWYDAGTDNEITAPDTFGCALLPLPCQCFGACASSYGYTKNDRKLLLQILADDKLQNKPWPDKLKQCFSPIADIEKYCAPLPNKLNKSEDKKANRKSNNGAASKNISSDNDSTTEISKLTLNLQPVFGSPMLDVALGQVTAINAVQEKLLGQVVRRQSLGVDDDDAQFDSRLPPEIPTDWVQCEDPSCRKWRRVAWHVDANALPDPWYCSMNYWEPADASHDAPQDDFDPETENTCAWGDVEQMEPITKENVGEWRDVYCPINEVYYEAKIKMVRTKDEKTEIKVGFKWWGARYDEWIDSRSERIRCHNLFTNSQCTCIQAQEAWQGGGRGGQERKEKENAKNAKNALKLEKLRANKGKTSKGKNSKKPGKKPGRKRKDDITALKTTNGNVVGSQAKIQKIN